MIYFVVVLMAAAASALQVSVGLGDAPSDAQGYVGPGDISSFNSQCQGANGHLSSLTSSLSQIKEIAQKRGETAIVGRCDEAQGHLRKATASFGLLADIFSDRPWDARGSMQSTEIRHRLSLCGNIISWIASQSQVQSFEGYRSLVSSCQDTYVSCQKTCGQIWSWPAPPTKPTPVHKPKPSQAHGDYYRRSVAPVVEVCPPFEDSCPLTSSLGGEECLDLQNEVASCGGCVSKKEGENCLEIVGADGVGCLDGHCVVFSVLAGYSLNQSGRPAKA